MSIRKYTSTKQIERLKKEYDYKKEKISGYNRISLGNGSITFRSEFEFNLAVLLDYNNIDFEYESQDEYILYHRNQKWNKHFERFGLTREDMVAVHHLYLPDFALKGEYENILLEPKGQFSQTDRTKMIKIQEQNKDKKIMMVLQSPNNKVTPKLKAHEWCEKHNIYYCTIENVVEKIKEIK